MSNETTWPPGPQKDETVEMLAQRASVAERRVVELERTLERVQRTIGELREPVKPELGWQPIETAPTIDMLIVRGPVDSEWHFYVSEGYYDGVKWRNSGNQILRDPTHWMPLHLRPGSGPRHVHGAGRGS